jgi:hypothetical protein
MNDVPEQELGPLTEMLNSCIVLIQNFSDWIDGLIAYFQ